MKEENKMKYIFTIVIVIMVYYGFYYQDVSVYTLPEVRSKAELLHDIANCESGNTHFASNTSILIHHNKDGSYDVGLFQINSVWYDYARSLGYNIFDLRGNEGFASWLYEQQGSSPWKSSQRCWQ